MTATKDVSALDLAFAYASSAKSAYSSNDMRLASRYWNRIYDLNLPFEQLATVMKSFSDSAVYAITGYIKNKYYQRK